MSGLVGNRNSTFIYRAGPSSWSERILHSAEASHARACVLLLALALACVLPGFVSLQPMDRDEPRFAQATKQMGESGNFVDIRFQDEARYKKPVGIHWLQAAAVETGAALGVPEARTTIALYRVPSLLGALAAVLLTYWAALAFAGRREAFLAAALVGASVILSVEARLAKTDAVLLACSVAAMGALARAWLARSAVRQPSSTLVIFWVAVAMGIMIKGPMVIMFTGLAALVLSVRERSAAWLGGLRPGLGILFVLLCVLPWGIAIAVKSGGEFYKLAVGDDMLGKVTTGQQKHWGPPGFYLVAFFATFFPGAILAAIAAPFAWMERRDDRVAFLAAWIVPSWLVFEAVPTKLPHYVMPLYPAVAILAVLAIAGRFSGPWRPGARAAFFALPLIPAGLALGLTYAAWTLDGRVPVAGATVMLAAVGVAIAAWLFFNRGEVTRAATTGVASAILLSVGVFGLTQPVFASLRISGRLVEAAHVAGCASPRMATLGYREPSLVFLAGTGLDMVGSGAEGASFLRGGAGCRVLFVDSRSEPAFREALGDRATRDPVARVGGFNINGGRRIDIGVYVASGAAAP